MHQRCQHIQLVSYLGWAQTFPKSEPVKSKKSMVDTSDASSDSSGESKELKARESEEDRADPEADEQAVFGNSGSDHSSKSEEDRFCCIIISFAELCLALSF